MKLWNQLDYQMQTPMEMKSASWPSFVLIWIDSYYIEISTHKSQIPTSTMFKEIFPWIMLRCCLVQKSQCSQSPVPHHTSLSCRNLLNFTNWFCRWRSWSSDNGNICCLEWTSKTWLKPPPVDIVRSTLWWLKTITLFWSLIFLEYPLWNQHNPWQ